jgi:GNAT superfamily N-acetyltransferase
MWDLMADLPELEAAAGDWLATDPVAHTVVLGVLAQAAADVPRDGAPLYAVLRRGQVVAGVAWRVPPFSLGVTGGSATELVALASLLVRARPDAAATASVEGPQAAAEALAGALGRFCGRGVLPGRRQTLYRLDEDPVLDLRPGPAGALRPAAREELELLLGWFRAFVAETGGVPQADPQARIERSVADGTMFVWEQDGRVLAMAGGRQTGAAVARIGPVYTPQPWRGQGVASALVAALALVLRRAGTQVVTLYADDANRTATGVYRRLGFVPVLPWREFALADA